MQKTSLAPTEVVPSRYPFLRSVATTLFTLFIYMYPAFVAVRLLDYLGWLSWLATVLEPWMAVFRLPGEAALVLITGYFVGVYAAVGILAALQLPPDIMTQLGLMIAIAHNLPVEVSILRAIGAPAMGLTLYRLGLSLCVGLVWALIFGGG